MHGNDADKGETLPANSHWQQCLNFYRFSTFIREEQKREREKKKMKISNINISIKFNANNKSKLATTNGGAMSVAGSSVWSSSGLAWWEKIQAYKESNI